MARNVREEVYLSDNWLKAVEDVRRSAEALGGADTTDETGAVLTQIDALFGRLVEIEKRRIATITSEEEDEDLDWSSSPSP